MWRSLNPAATRLHKNLHRLESFACKPITFCPSLSQNMKGGGQRYKNRVILMLYALLMALAIVISGR